MSTTQNLKIISKRCLTQAQAAHPAFAGVTKATPYLLGGGTAKGYRVSSSQLLSHKVKRVCDAAGLPAQPAYSTGTLGSALTTQLCFLACFSYCLHHHPRPSTRIFPPDYGSNLLSGPLSLFLTNSKVYPHTKGRLNFQSNHIIPRLKILL